MQRKIKVLMVCHGSV